MKNGEKNNAIKKEKVKIKIKYILKNKKEKRRIEKKTRNFKR